MLAGGEDTISGIVSCRDLDLTRRIDGGTGNREYESADERSATEAGGVSTNSDGILPSTGVGGTNICTEAQRVVRTKENKMFPGGPPVLSCPSSPVHDLLQAF